MNILLTGGAGFIGSNLADAFLDAGHDVAIVDDLSMGRRENVPGKAVFCEMDICDPRMEEVFGRERPHVVCHYAAQTSVTASVRAPEADARVNIFGTLNLLRASVKHRVRKFVYASTGGALYDFAEALPAREDHPIAPASPYGLSKFAAERYVALYGDIHGLDYTILRYGNVYGPRQRPDGEAGVVAIFATRMLRGQQPVIFGDGSKTRDYVHVRDVIAANFLALEAGGGEVFNVAGGTPTRDDEVFAAVRDALGVDIEPVHEAVRPGEVIHSCLDCGKIERTLGWRPALEFRRGVAETVESYRKLIARSGQ